jgi:hypothetical protein
VTPYCDDRRCGQAAATCRTSAAPVCLCLGKSNGAFRPPCTLPATDVTATRSRRVDLCVGEESRRKRGQHKVQSNTVLTKQGHQVSEGCA